MDEGVEIGEGSKIWHFSHILRRCDGSAGMVNVGQNVVIGPRVTIGDNVKIQNNVSVYEGVTLEDGVFCGPSCVFTNVNNPRCRDRAQGEFRPTLVKRGATIGANATIVCGHTLGEYCLHRRRRRRGRRCPGICADGWGAGETHRLDEPCGREAWGRSRLPDRQEPLQGDQGRPPRTLKLRDLW